MSKHNQNELETITRDHNSPPPLVVRATHNYTPVNNDELHVQVGDVITVTNPEEGGWWEGTLGTKTGWFPSNYVVPMVDSNGNNNAVANGNMAVSVPPPTSEYRRMIINELIETESAHVTEMQDFHDNVLKKLGSVLPPQDASTLTNNYQSIITTHKTQLLSPLQSSQSQPPNDQRVGRIFLSAAPHLEQVHKAYCSNHPRAVQVVERHKEKLATWWSCNHGEEQRNGVLRIIVLLSAPFRRLEKYVVVLNEIEKHVEEFHRDRGDVQRSVAYFRDVEKATTRVRKQKEMELEVLTPGAIKDFEGSDVSTLGDILLMSLVFLGPERQPRYFVLFSNTIVLLSYDTITNTLTYKGRVLVSGVTVVDDDPDTHAFEISGPTIHTMTIECPNKSTKSDWLKALNDLLRASRYPSFGASPCQQVVPSSPPFVELVRYFRMLYDNGVIVSRSTEFLNSYVSYSHAVIKRNRVVPRVIIQCSSQVNRGFCFKTKCLSNIADNPEVVFIERGSMRVQSLDFSSTRDRNSSTFRCSSLPWGFSPVNVLRRRVLVRQDAFDYGGDVRDCESFDSGLGDKGIEEFDNDPVYYNEVFIQYFGALAPPLQAWNITRLRPSPPYNPFLADNLRHSVSSSSKKNSLTSLVKNVSNEDDFAVLSIVDGFCGKGVPLDTTTSYIKTEHPVIEVRKLQQHNFSSNVRSLPLLVHVLRDDIAVLQQRIGQLSRQLEDEASARKNV